MARQHALESSASPAQEPLSHAHVPGRLRDLVGAHLEREIYLSTLEAAQLVGSPTREAFIAWARRHHIPLRKASPTARTLRVKKGDIDFALRVR